VDERHAQDIRGRVFHDLPVAVPHLVFQELAADVAADLFGSIAFVEFVMPSPRIGIAPKRPWLVPGDNVRVQPDQVLRNGGTRPIIADE
jgi:hypothetical protein